MRGDGFIDIVGESLPERLVGWFAEVVKLERGKRRRWVRGPIIGFIGD